MFFVSVARSRIRKFRVALSRLFVPGSPPFERSSFGRDLENPCRGAFVQQDETGSGDDVLGPLGKQVADASVQYDQEGVKAEEESFASASGDDERAGVPEPADARARLESEPEGETIEISGEFTGMTPRSRPIEPGE